MQLNTNVDLILQLQESHGLDSDGSLKFSLGDSDSDSTCHNSAGHGAIKRATRTHMQNGKSIIT